MNRRVRTESGYGTTLAVAALTLCTLAFFCGCDDFGNIDIDEIVDVLAGTEPGGSMDPGESDDCQFRNDGECDDGRPGSITGVCPAGSDPEDCDGVGGGSSDDCLNNLDRFSGTYSLSVISRELGIQDYSTEGVDICGAGEEFFGDLPTSATISVSGNSASMSVDINSTRYSASGTFQGPTAPKKPLIGGTFYESTNSAVTPGVNSCGAESPYIFDSRQFSEDGGQTTLTLFVYTQVDAINIVVEAFFVADDSEVLSPCHGVIILQGTI